MVHHWLFSQDLCHLVKHLKWLYLTISSCGNYDDCLIGVTTGYYYGKYRNILSRKFTARGTRDSLCFGFPTTTQCFHCVAVFVTVMEDTGDQVQSAVFYFPYLKRCSSDLVWCLHKVKRLGRFSMKRMVKEYSAGENVLTFSQALKTTAPTFFLSAAQLHLS